MTIEAKPPSARTLHLGVACDPRAMKAWMCQCLRRLAATEGVELTLLVPGDQRAPESHAMKGWLWRAYSACMVRHRSRALAPASLPEQAKTAPQVSLDTSKELAALDLDAVLCLLPETPEALLTLAPRHGVWVFRYGPEGVWNRVLPAVWEILGGERLLCASLQRLPDVAGDRRILRSGCARTVRESYSASVDVVLAMCATWPAQVCNDIRLGHSGDWQAAPVDEVELDRRQPGNLQVIGLRVKLVVSALRELCERMMLPDWHIGVIEQPITAFLQPGWKPEIRWLPQPRMVFRADPFGIVHQGQLIILYERFDHHVGEGELWALTAGDCVTDVQPVLRNLGHLSYPYLIEHQGQIYCVPEVLASNEISLYRADEFPTAWTKVATLVPDFQGGDPTVFQHEDRWWLLAIDSSQHTDHTLYAWYADDLFGPWTPHANNPIKMDVRSSRPAGTPFVHQGRLIRPTQNCALRYGHHVTLNHVLRLTPTEFAEVPLTTVGPFADSPYSAGLHTLSAVGGRTLVDSLRYSFFAWDLRLLLYGIRRFPQIVCNLWKTEGDTYNCH